MCGIGGVVCFKEHRLDVERIQAMLLHLEPRGQCATGVAYHDGDSIIVRKAPGPASEFLRAVPPDVWKAIAQSPIVLLHTRSATQGDPCVNENNHPVVHEPWLAIHNGVITNDAEVFASLKVKRSGTVDSAAIPAALATRGPAGLGLLSGTAALAAWSADAPDQIILARLGKPPLEVEHHQQCLIFGSTLPPVTSPLVEGVGVSITPWMRQISLGSRTLLAVNTAGALHSEATPLGQEIPHAALTWRGGRDWVARMMRQSDAPPEWSQPTPTATKDLGELHPPAHPQYCFPPPHYEERFGSGFDTTVYTIFGRWVRLRVDGKDVYRFHPFKSVKKWYHREKVPHWWEQVPVETARPLLRIPSLVKETIGAREYLCPWCGVSVAVEHWKRASKLTHLCPWCSLPASVPAHELPFFYTMEGQR